MRVITSFLPRPSLPVVWSVYFLCDSESTSPLHHPSPGSCLCLTPHTDFTTADSAGRQRCACCGLVSAIQWQLGGNRSLNLRFMSLAVVLFISADFYNEKESLLQKCSFFPHLNSNPQINRAMVWKAAIERQWVGREWWKENRKMRRASIHKTSIQMLHSFILWRSREILVNTWRN